MNDISLKLSYRKLRIKIFNISNIYVSFKLFYLHYDRVPKPDRGIKMWTILSILSKWAMNKLGIHNK